MTVGVEARWEFRALDAVRLPVFRRDVAPHDKAGYAAFYAPGFLTVVEAAQADRLETVVREQTEVRADVRADVRAEVGTALGREAADLVTHARQALRRREAMLTAPFLPVCLTLYVGDRCNLRCTYCHAAPPVTARASLSAADVEPAARFVAANCARTGRPMAVVVHGGGEPGLHRAVVDEALDVTARCAAQVRVETFRYVATNGVLPAETVRWLARRFDVVGLSCDGPDDVQAVQRPTRTGRSTSRAVERTADLVRDAGTGLHVRATVTPATLGRLTEIVGYLCDHLAPDEIHVEPVYRGGRAGPGDGFSPDDVPAFVNGLLAARTLADGRGVPLRTAASRPSEIHGPFCQVFRDVLQLIPGGVVSACFKDTGATSQDTGATSQDTGATAGWAEIGRSTAAGGVVLDDRRIAALRARLGEWPVRCASCFNRFHCTLGCPDRCPADEAESLVVNPHPSENAAGRCAGAAQPGHGGLPPGSESSAGGAEGSADGWDGGRGGFWCALGRELAGRTLSEAADAVWREAHHGV